jgi:hypothetical protein
MNGKARYGRRYSLKIDGELHDPDDFNDLGWRCYNPSNLKKDCRMVADSVAVALGVEVIIVKHLAEGDREEAFVSDCRWTW